MSDSLHPNDSLAYQIRGTFRTLETALSRYLTSIDIPLSHFHVLRVAWDKTGMSQRELCEMAFMTEGVLSQVVQSMEALGYVERKADPNDARKRLVFITRKGRRLRTTIVTQGIHILNESLEGISEQDINVALDVLIKVRLQAEKAMGNTDA